jgi:MinD-like ATPase involved in chromosome partitioning or flagellar assembly
MSGESVLALDMDIEAGGLNIIFKGDIEEMQETEKPKGLVKCLIQNDIEAVKSAIEDLKAYRPYQGINLIGPLHLLPIYPSAYLMDQIQSKFNVPQLFAETIRALKQKIVEEFDYSLLLVDLPTGNSPLRELFIKMCDKIILISRPNLQGAYGTKKNKDEFDARGFDTTFVLSCVPNLETKQSKAKIKEFQKSAGLHKIDHIIPFDEGLAFTEEIPVITRPKSKIAKVFNSIAQGIKE